MAEHHDKDNDWIGEGWHKLDPKIVIEKAPKIQWGERYKRWSDKKKIKYLEDMACSMNHAAYLIQLERDELNELCAKKEQNLMTMSHNMGQNNDMTQTLVMQMNEERHQWNAAAEEMKSRLRELENK